MIECKLCLFNNNLETVTLDKNNICNYCKEFKKYRFFFDKSKQYSINKLKEISRKIRSQTKKEKYNCLIGVREGLTALILFIWQKNEFKNFISSF